MSRIGKKTIVLPGKVEFNYNADTNLVEVKGPLGKLSLTLDKHVTIKQEGENVNLVVENETNKFQRAIWGTNRALVYNMIVGVTEGFKKDMELNGVGYKMELTGDLLTLYIGFSHTVPVKVPSAIKLTLVKNLLTGHSSDNQLIGNFFNTIHNMKPCDPYKGKGFKFPGRFYRRKVVKKTK